MPYSISTAKDDLTGILHGTSLSKVTNLTNLMDRAGRDLLAAVDPAETKRTVELPVLYDKTYDYAAPADLKGDRIIDIKPTGRRWPSDQFTQTYDQTFDVDKDWIWNGGLATTNWNTGIKSLRIAKNMRAGQLLNGCESLTSNGTWTAGGDVTGLIVDNVNFIQGSASIRFGLSGAGTTGYVECSGMDPIDLTDDEGLGAEFLWQYLPSASQMTSVNLRWGNDSLNYWDRTVTSNSISGSFQDLWNLLRYDWNQASSTGSPDASSVSYLRVSYVYDGEPMDGLRIDGINAQRGLAYQVEYYSKYLFRDAVTGIFQETVTSDTNLINLDTDSYNLYLYKLAELAAPQVQGQDSAYDAKFYGDKWTEALRQYQGKYKSEVKKPSQPYYRMPHVRGKYFYGGKNWN